ncbi:family 2 encapsulin nanocompartment cargo protein terpene cyclase [Streptomyces sp. NPDC060031]|uniref:family 2 encapsulin nanocompartment cargo protein terpene cyclase n=1 Tax=Streptomyces sp. NPDC060031 TaxID=3347043 RepID=UPI003691BEAF
MDAVVRSVPPGQAAKPAGQGRGPFLLGPRGLGTSAARIVWNARPEHHSTSVPLSSRPPVVPGLPVRRTAPVPSSPPAATTSSTALGVSLYCPGPVRVDEPLGAEVNERLLAWVQRVGIFPGRLDAVRACNYGRYAMLIHPDCDDPDRLLLAAQCMAALFAVDDYYCDDERTGSDTALVGNRLTLAQTALDPAYLVGGWGHQEQLEEALASDPVLVALRSYIDRVAGFATPAQVGRVRHETVAMFVAMNGEAGWRTTQTTPAVWEYLAARQVNSFLPCMTLIDVISGYELPATLYSHPPVRRATMLAASASIILNDLYSMNKEAEPGIGDGGLPDVIAAERGCTPREAVQLSAAYHDELVRAFEAARSELTATIPSPELWRYLTGLHAWLGGNHEWHATTGRYATATGDRST